MPANIPSAFEGLSYSPTPQEDIWRSVPQCDDFVAEGVDWDSKGSG